MQCWRVAPPSTDNPLIVPQDIKLSQTHLSMLHPPHPSPPSSPHPHESPSRPCMHQVFVAPRLSPTMLHHQRHHHNHHHQQLQQQCMREIVLKGNEDGVLVCTHGSFEEGQTRMHFPKTYVMPACPLVIRLAASPSSTPPSTLLHPVSLPPFPVQPCCPPQCVSPDDLRVFAESSCHSRIGLWSLRISRPSVI